MVIFGKHPPTEFIELLHHLRTFRSADLSQNLEIELYTNAVLEKLNIEQLLEKDGVVTENDNTSENGFSKPLLPSPISLQDVSTLLIESCNKKAASSYESN